MRTGAAAGHEGYFHEAFCYADDDEFLAGAVPFLRDGSDAGEPTIVVLGERKSALIRSALPRAARVDFTGDDQYSGPAAALRAYRELLAGHVAAGAAQVRVFGELPAAVFGATWESWARYEATVNVGLDEFPLWTMCSYDRRIAPAEALRDVARTHGFVAGPDGGHARNDSYTSPEAFLAEPRPTRLDPIELTVPCSDLTDPTPGEARRAVRAADPGLVPEARVTDLMLATSEAVTNAMLHGRAPIRVRIWPGGDRLVVAVTDAGTGPSDPFAGLLPASAEHESGRGLWILNQSCDHVVQRHDADGYTIRMTAGDPH